MSDKYDTEAAIYPPGYAERIASLKPDEQEAVKKFWRSVVMRSHRAFSEENGRLPCSTVRSCNCCPYGYHIDLDFVRYCESLANAKPSEEQLRRRSRRRSRMSMEFMLGLDSLFDQWDAAERVQMVPEATHELEPESPRMTQPQLTSTPYASHQYNNNNNDYRPLQHRANSVPRFTYGGLTRSESPCPTSSSTCSSLRDNTGESDTTASVPFPQRRPTNSPPETRAFLHDALDEVCSDFERTLERASMKRKKAGVAAVAVGGTDVGDGAHRRASDGNVLTCSDRNNNYTGFVSSEKRNCSTWESYVDALDTCVAGNKSPRNSRSFTRSATLPLPPTPHKQRQQQEAQQQYESYVLASVAANAAKSSLERVPPPPPPRRHALLGLNSAKALRSPTPDPVRTPLIEKAANLVSPTTNLTTTDGANANDAQTLHNIRQQMALSLNRMKDLEEQVKTIPELQNELSQLRDEKQQLQTTLQRKDDELSRAREATRLSASPSPVASPKFASPVQFTPQRISPIALESLGARLRTNSTSSEKQLKSPPTPVVLKRDVGTMSQLHTTRDIAVGSIATQQRDTGTNPMHTLRLSEVLYTRHELDEHIALALQTHEHERETAQHKRRISVGTQMFVPQRNVRDTGAQTVAERPVLKYTVGVTAKPQTRESFVTCKPDMRAVACSDDRIDDVLCAKCVVTKRSVACGTTEVDAPAAVATAVSLKLLDMPPRSNTFSLGDNEKLPPLVSRKTIGTQCLTPVRHAIGVQTSAAPNTHTVAVQHAPQLQTCGTQCATQTTATRQTDTRDLIHLRATATDCVQIAAATPAKAATRTCASNTDMRHTVDNGVNTLAPAAQQHAACNTDAVGTRDIACGDIVKPHISIACADNYCDSCKDAIKHLAKDFTKVSQPSPVMATPPSPLPQRAADSRIPRPKHMSSPSPVRKQFQRQNTYTITPSPTPSPVAEKRTLLSSHSELPARKTATTTSAESLTSTPESTPRRPSNADLTNVFATSPSKTYALNHEAASLGLDDLIVREETRVEISWSRDASPAPTKDGASSVSTPPSTKPPTQHEKLDSSIESSSSKSSSPEVTQGGARRKTTPQKSSQSDVTATTDETVVEVVTTRERLQPTKELLAALQIINDSLRRPSKGNAKSTSMKAAMATLQQEWFSIASTETSLAFDVEDYLLAFRDVSVPLLEHGVNLVDSNGNTAMHYAVSHGNFEIVSTLLDSKVCNVNQMNNAGYTCVMLVSLAKLKNAAHRTVVQRLFQMADVNIRAKKHCQTALMLAVSHGNLDMVEMLLAAGADINLQDEDGSTALMCAAEHGRVDIVKHLLSQAECNSLVQDVDGSTAFKIAWQAGHRDIGLLLYVHEQMLRSKMPKSEMSMSTSARTPSLSPRTTHKRQPSQ